MKWLILLVVGVVAAEDQLKLAERIVSTEQECGRLYKLNENWSTNNYNDQAVLYVDLFFLCEDSLAEDKYAYIDHNHLDMSLYPDEDENFPVLTSNGMEWVKKPPTRSNEDVVTMQEKLTDYLSKLGGKHNPLFKLTNIQSERTQEIVDQQVTCELLGLWVVNHPEDEASAAQHTACMDELNCIKEMFMAHHSFSLDAYPDFFPILYKGRGTMINSPPPSDGTSLCVQPVNPDVYKKDLQKWVDIKGTLQKVGHTAEENLEIFKNAGNELINKLKKMGPGPIMTKEQMETLMDDVESITVVEEDEEDDSEPQTTPKLFAKYGARILEKMAELESETMKNMDGNKLEEINEVNPKAHEPVDKLASEAVDHLKTVEANKLKPAIKKTMKSLSDAESQVKIKSEAAVEDIKDKMTTVNDAGKEAATKLKEDGSVLLHKLKSKTHDKPETESSDEDDKDSEKPNRGTLSEFADKIAHSEYFSKNLNNLEKSVVDKFLAKLGGNDQGEELLSDDHILEILNTMKDDIKKKAESMNINEDEIKQAAMVLKTVLQSILNAGKNGVGPAKGMTVEEIEDANALLNELVDFATQDTEENAEDGSEEDEQGSKVLEQALENVASPIEESLSHEAEEEKDLKNHSKKGLPNLSNTDEQKDLTPEENEEKTLEDLKRDLKIPPRLALPTITYPGFPVNEDPTSDSTVAEEVYLTPDGNGKQNESSTDNKEGDSSKDEKET